MDTNKQKELFSISYLQALCAAAAVNHGVYVVDDDSVDVTLTKKGLIGTGAVYSPKLDIQLKCTADELTDNGETFSFSLKKKNYNELRIPNSSAPRLLLVLRVPRNLEAWIIDGENEITLNHCAYWLSLKDMEETEQDKVTVYLPKSNRLTIKELGRIMMSIGSGLEL